MTKYTPGPWVVAPSTTPGYGFDIRAGKKGVALIEGRDAAHASDKTDEETVANAVAIAALPDLIAALLGLMPLCDNGGSLVRAYDDRFASARAALIIAGVPCDD